jgi:hypothetical protein
VFGTFETELISKKLKHRITAPFKGFISFHFSFVSFLEKLEKLENSRKIKKPSKAL